MVASWLPGGVWRAWQLCGVRMGCWVGGGGEALPHFVSDGTELQFMTMMRNDTNLLLMG
jgi:hypothetical protein